MPPQKKEQLEGMVTTEAAIMKQETPASDRKEASMTKRRSRRKTAVANAGAAEQDQETASSVVITEDIPAEEPPAAPMKTQNALLQVLEGPLKKKERNETHERNRVYIRKDLKERLDALAEHRSKGFKTLLLNYGLEKALDELEVALRNAEE